MAHSPPKAIISYNDFFLLVERNVTVSIQQNQTKENRR